MTLGRLVLAWLPVGVWFVGVAWAGARWRGDAGAGTWAPPRPRRIGWLLAEAGVVTLFASLWFDSLGSGGWWLVFLLVGVLAAFPPRLRDLPEPGPARRNVLLQAGVDVARYVAAGWILAWRLG
jgi:hypothetical protein